MRYRILIADFDLARIARLGHTRVIERYGYAESMPAPAKVEDWLKRAGAIPEGYLVAMVKEVRL